MEHWITRREIIEEACNRMLHEMYMRAQPPVNIDEYTEKFKNGELDLKKDMVCDWHYLPSEIEKQIIKDYLNAYNANDNFKFNLEWLIQLFKEGGMRTAYKDIFGTGEKVRVGEYTEKLNELIGDENAEKVYNLINEFLGFYRTNLDEHIIRGTIFKCPTSSKEKVIKKWGPDFKIDDSVYKGWDNELWDYTYKDYYNGKVSEDYLEEIEWEEKENSIKDNQ